MPTMFRGQVKNIHFVGIGGIGMSGIAEVLLGMGYSVSGSDLNQSETTRRLESLGARVHTGHRAQNLRRADVVVVTSAARPENPEILAARSGGIPVIHRADMLAELMRHRHGLAISGSHGKTSTTSLLAAILDRSGLDPTMVVGGRLKSLGSNARFGRGEYLLAEADESDGSFLKLPATVAVVTNIDPEHMDHYGTEERLRQAFADFVNKVPFYGLCVLCADCENVRSLLPRVERRFVTYGVSSDADYTARDITARGPTTCFTPVHRGKARAPVTLGMVGRHNVNNALAAMAVADELEVPHEVTREALGAFDGVGRRFTIRGEAGGVMVVDDYGHHPTEIRATLAGAREAFGRRVVAVFQPHRFSRTQLLFQEFAGAFGDADMLLLTDIYAASEDPLEGVNSARLAAEIRSRGHKDVTHLPEKDAALQQLRERVQPGDIVVTLGAGDIWRVGQGLLEWLQRIPR